MKLNDFSLFALESTRAFGENVGRRLNAPLSEHEERQFEDGEHKARPLESVRGKDVYVIQSLYSDREKSVNDKLCRLLFFLGAVRDAGAGRVTAVSPYLAYARKDRKTKSRDPTTIRYLAQLIEAVGADRVVVLEVHNLAAFQNAFRIETVHLDAAPLFADHFAPLAAGAPVTVMSPDAGGVKRAELVRQALSEKIGSEVPFAFMEKTRSEEIVRGDLFAGAVEGRRVIIIDDLISSGTTLLRAAKACRERGANEVQAAAAHGLFIGDADQVLSDPSLDRVAVTDTLPPFRLDPHLAKTKLDVLDAASLVAEAIRRLLHENGSVSELTPR
ncbi:MAG: ribose-phosphate pyrophosphokinase [Planctomycetes bacterium]|nr:ribose-phosphate pyrophosphokinase [Planctomycetota bacterium]